MKVYDIQKMQELLHDFYNLTGIKMCIYDSEEHELCYYPEKLTPFCRALREDGHRADPPPRAAVCGNGCAPCRPVRAAAHRGGRQDRLRHPYPRRLRGI